MNLWNYAYSSCPTLGIFLFGAVKLVKNADINKCKYSGCSVGFIIKGTFGFLGLCVLIYSYFGFQYFIFN